MAEIVSTEDVLGGEPRIAGSRVGVLDVYDLASGGYSPTDVADQLDRTVAEVHAALAYYYEHPERMRALRRDRSSSASFVAEVDVLDGEYRDRRFPPHRSSGRRVGMRRHGPPAH